MSKPIRLKTKSPGECTGVIRLSPEAEQVVRRLKAKTNLSTKTLVSQIILQAEDLSEIIPAEDDDDAEDT